MYANDKGLVFEKYPTDEESAVKYANRLYATGYYPAGLDSCFCVGISGGCGLECFVYQNGECRNPDELYDNCINKDSEEEKEHFEMYPESFYAKKQINEDK